MANVLNAPPDSMAWIRHDKSDDLSMYKRSTSTRVDTCCSRQMTVFFSMKCCLCGKKRSKDKDLLSSSVNRNLLFQRSDGHTDEKASAERQQSWWQESWQLLGSIRKARSWSERDASGDEVYCKLPKWKQFLRKLRAETRKMNCATRSPGFNYDPLSYAMNFDEGCWQCDLHGQGYLHSMRFSAPMVLESESFRRQNTPDSLTGKSSENVRCRKSLSFPRSSSLSVWQRRKTSNPPSLDLRMVRV